MRCEDLEEMRVQSGDCLSNFAQVESECISLLLRLLISICTNWYSRCSGSMSWWWKWHSSLVVTAGVLAADNDERPMTVNRMVIQTERWIGGILSKL